MNLQHYQRATTRNSTDIKLARLVNELKDEISDLRKEVATIASDLRSLTESQKRQDQAIFDGEGGTHLSSMKADISAHANQLKGLWATVGIIVACLSTFALYHLRL